MKRKIHGSDLRSVRGLRAIVLLLVLAVLFASGLAPASAETRTETRTYNGVEDYVCSSDDYSRNLNWAREYVSLEPLACFKLDGTENEVSLTLADDTGLENTYYTVWLYNPRTTPRWSHNSFCRPVTLLIPEGTTHIEVDPKAIAIRAYCTPATTGTVTAVFTS